MVHGILYSGIIQSTVCDDTRHSAIDATTLNGLERHHTLDSQLSHDLFDGMYYCCCLLHIELTVDCYVWCCC